MCRVLGVAPSGYYKWLATPLSRRAQEDARLLQLIKASFTASHGIYGAPIVMDLFSRKVVGWSAQPTIQRDLVLDAVLMAVRRRREERFGDGIVPTVALSAPAWLETVGPA